MRPTSFFVSDTIYWTISTANASGVLLDADSVPTVAVRRDGVASADVVTVTKRAATTGLYDCSYTPASVTAGEQFTIKNPQQSVR